MEEDTTPVEELAGVPDGTELQTPEGEPNEKVVYDKDENGNVTGWHKEPVGE